MPRIERRVTQEQKEAWQAFCKSQNIGESEMLGLILQRVTAGQVSFEFNGLEEPKSEKVTVRLARRDIQRMTVRAKSFVENHVWLA